MKPWYQSSTIWLNVVAVAVVAGLEFIQPIIPPEYAAAVAFVLNIVNRFRTTQAVTLR